MGVIKNDLRSGVERDYPVFNFLGIRTNGKRDRIWHYLAACDCAERDCIASRGYYGLVRILPPDIHFYETKNDATRVETYRDSSERNVFGSHVMKVQSRRRSDSRPRESSLSTSQAFPSTKAHYPLGRRLLSDSDSCASVPRTSVRPDY